MDDWIKHGQNSKYCADLSDENQDQSVRALTSNLEGLTKRLAAFTIPTSSLKDA
jgi:hypothetical protein